MLRKCSVDLAVMLIRVFDVSGKEGHLVSCGVLTDPQCAARNAFTCLDHKKVQQGATRHEQVETCAGPGEHELVGTQWLPEEPDRSLLRRGQQQATVVLVYRATEHEGAAGMQSKDTMRAK